MKHSIAVKLNRAIDRSYTITVEQGMLSSIPSILLRTFGRTAYYIITDSTVARIYGRTLLRACADRDLNAIMLDFPPGEASKNSDIVAALQTKLLEHGIRRESIVLALGGGVVGDVAGYVAATVLRGVRYIQVPTTLLAQVDSSVGGKVGIDHPSGKNLIGAFHQPSAVFVDPDVLRSLPNPEFKNGLAEMVKIAAALDKKYFAKLERAAGRIRKFGSGALTECIACSIGLKAAVVQQDEFEAGLRKTLNLGHTIGHAIEAASDYSIRHGAAVAMGLAVEGTIATSLGILPMAEYQRLIRLLRKLGLPSTMPPVRDRKKFFGALSLDKKASDGNAKYVLMNAIGKSVVGVDVPASYLEGVLTRP